MNVLALNNRVRFTLKSKGFDSVSIVEPIGWDNDDKEFSRNDTYPGVFTSMSNNLTFVGDAADYIEMVRNTEGILAELRIIKEERHPCYDDWQLSYAGYLDMTTYQKENGKVKLKFNSGGIESILKSRESEMVEIDRTHSIDDKFLSPFGNTELINYPGRKIFLQSTWEAVPMTYYKQLEIAGNDGDTYTATNTMPFDLITKSHEQAQMTADGMDGNFENGQSTMMLLYNMDRRRIVTIKIENLRFWGNTRFNNPINWGHINVSLTKYRNGSDLNRSDSIDLWFREVRTTDDDRLPFPNVNGEHIINAEYTFILEAGESLGLETMVRADLNSSSGTDYRRDFYYKLESGKISITENSEFDPSIIRAVKPFFLINRLAEIITNKKDAVKSEILQNGKWKNLLITHGFWIRNFSREQDAALPEENRKFKPLTTSFKDFMTSFTAVTNLGLGIERNGYEEKIVIEDLSYFFNQNVTIQLPYQVKNLKRSIDVSKYYRNIEVGFEKGGEYEEAMKLDEYNVKNTYTTVVNNVTNSYKQVSKYRADSYGIEFARRKPFRECPTEDTNYDQDIFFIDCKDEPMYTGFGTFHQPRTYHNDFNNVPMGVFSPETAYNLRLSPFNSLLRHDWAINSGLTLYPNG